MLKIPDAIEQLSSWPDALVDREGVGKVLGVERRDAQRILQKAGATAVPGRSALIPPKDLILYLQVIGGDEIAAAEKERRREFARRLGQFRKDRIERGAPLLVELEQRQSWPVSKLGFLGLPEGVRIGRGVVVFEFRTIQQLLHQVSLFAMALQGDGDGKSGVFPELERLCGVPSVTPAPWPAQAEEDRVRSLKDDLDGALVLATPEEIARILGDKEGAA